MTQRDWTSTGAAMMGADLEDGRRLSRRLVSDAIDDLIWLDASGELNLPVVIGGGINNAIRQLRLPKVSQVAYQFKTIEDGDVTTYSLAPFGLYGIEANYRNGQARVYLLDIGSEILPLCSDFQEVPSP